HKGSRPIGSQKVGATVGTTAAPDKRRQLGGGGRRGTRGRPQTTKTHRLQHLSRGCLARAGGKNSHSVSRSCRAELPVGLGNARKTTRTSRNMCDMKIGQ